MVKSIQGGMVKRKLGYAAALAAVLGCVATYFAVRYGVRYCTAMKAANISKEIKDRTPLDCAEFWINRYQTLAAAAFAVVAAYFSIRATREQTAAGQRTNENIARVAIYDALRAYSHDAFAHLRDIDGFDNGTLAAFDRSPPSVDLSEQKTLVAHLPTELAKRIFRFERRSAGLISNRDTLRTQNVPVIHLYTRIRLSVLIVECEAIVEETGKPIGIYDPLFAPDIWRDLIVTSQSGPASNGSSEVATWLEEQADKRRRKMLTS